MRSVIPWSFSMLEAYDTCPRAFYELKLAKNYKEDNDAVYLQWGNEVHKKLEDRVKIGRPLPDNMKQWEPIALSIVRAPGDKYCESELAFTKDLLPCGFWDAACWNRGKDDVIIVNYKTAANIDYKTGKKKNNQLQLELAAARTMTMFPEVEKVITSFAWLQTKEWTRAIYTRDDLNRLWDTFRSKVADLEWSEKNNTWPAKPSGLCKRSRKPGSTYMGCIVASCPHSEYYRGNK